MSMRDEPGCARARAAARDFVTQRAVQQLLFTSRELRDETAANWLDDFAGGGLHDRHVADALRDAGGNRIDAARFLRALLSAPVETLTIKKPYAGRGGTTRENPYIEKKYFTYDVDIVPRFLGRRVLEARKQIADELANDLALVPDENARLWRCFRQAVEKGDDISIVDALDAPASEALLDTGAYPGVDQGSPYREANYDLALNYTLYLGIMDTVDELGRSTRATDQRARDWLIEFCKGRAAGLLLPPRGIRRAADAFIAALLSEPPRLSGTEMLDPMRICERILDGRLATASQNWIPIFLSAAQEHIDIERQLLEDSL
jgi:hypothetical protein